MHRGRSILLSCVVGLWSLQAAAQNADLLISKSGPESISAGDTIVYSIFVFNGGPADAQNVTVSDTLPAGTTFVSLTASSAIFNCSAPVVGAGGPVSCTAATFANQDETTFTLSVKTSPAAPSGMISNTASISSSTPDANTSDNSSTITTGIVGASTTSADLSIETMFGPASVNPGTTMSFRVAIANNGPSTAHHVQLVDAVPANATFVSVSVADPLGVFTCTTPAVGTTGNITCSAPSLDPQSSSDQPTFFFTFRVNNGLAPGTVLTNTATLSADESDPVPFNNSFSKSTTATAQAPSADLSVVTSGTGSMFGVTVRNSGPNDAASVTLTDDIPAGSTFASWTQNSGPAFNCTTPAAGAGGTVTCSIGVLPGFSAPITTADFVLTVNAGGQVTNTVTVSSTTPDPQPDNNTSTYPVAAKLSVDDVSVVEGNTGTTPAVFTVRLQPANPSLTASVDYAVLGLTAPSGSDFAPAAGTLTFRPGETQKTITVTVFGDTVGEGDETFTVQLSSPVNANIERGQGIGTIIDDDFGGPTNLPVATIDSVRVPEGNSGFTIATFTAHLSALPTTLTSVRWITQDGTAKAGSDYVASAGEVFFQPGQLERTFPVLVFGDTNFEPDEFFNIIITGADNAVFAPGIAATATILNDDAQPPTRHRAVRP
jgi:uncharacterized repeat protein (TIGR01451 family)